MTDHFLSTSAHYPRSRSRNTPFSTLKFACLNGKFLTFGDRFTSLAFDQKILRGVRHQVIYSHHVDCIAVPWGSSSLSVIPLALVNSLHYWLVIKRCLSMFDSSSLFTWIDLYFEWRSEEIEDPWSSFSHPGCDIFRKIKTSDVQHYGTDNHPIRMMALPESSVYFQTVICPMYMSMNL